MNNNEIWIYYGLAAVPLVFLPMLTTVKQGLLKKLWIGYCFGSVVLGIVLSMKDDKIKHKDNKHNKQ